jgi:transcriptional regulator with XRE-family HTH domain
LVNYLGVSTKEERIGKCIAHWRKLRNLSQSDLAQAIGVDKGTIWRIEHAKNAISLNTLNAIAHHLSIEPEKLIAGESPSKRPTKDELALGIIRRILAMDEAELWVNARRLGVIALTDGPPPMEAVRARSRNVKGEPT